MMPELFAVPTLLAYIGPGAGLELLGPLLGVLMAAGGALLMAAAWPLRWLLSKLTRRKPQEQAD